MFAVDAVRGGEPERAGGPGAGVRPVASLLQLAGPAPAQGLRPQREAGGLHLPLPRRWHHRRLCSSIPHNNFSMFSEIVGTFNEQFSPFPRFAGMMV